jgi:hypothetical protein
MTKSRLFRGERTKTSTERKPPPQTQLPNKSGQKGYSSNYSSNSGPRNNANRNGKYCSYCKLQNHTQDECFKRIRETKPCRDRQGRANWPRVYLTENSDSQNQGQQPGFHSRAWWYPSSRLLASFRNYFAVYVPFTVPLAINWEGASSETFAVHQYKKSIRKENYKRWWCYVLRLSFLLKYHSSYNGYKLNGIWTWM